MDNDSNPWDRNLVVEVDHARHYVAFCLRKPLGELSDEEVANVVLGVMHARRHWMDKGYRVIN